MIDIMYKRDWHHQLIKKPALTLPQQVFKRFVDFSFYRIKAVPYCFYPVFFINLLFYKAFKISLFQHFAVPRVRKCNQFPGAFFQAFAK